MDVRTLTGTMHVQIQFKDDTLIRHNGRNYVAPDLGVTKEVLEGLRAHGV